MRSDFLTERGVGLQYQRIAQLLASSGLARLTHWVLQNSLPSIRITTETSDDAFISVGSSKFGGWPDLPSALAWPQSDDLPCEFVAQLNLSTVQVIHGFSVLPDEGMLYFFRNRVDDEEDSESECDWKVWYYSGCISLLKRVRLDNEPDYSSCKLMLFPELTIPPVDCVSVDGAVLDYDEMRAYLFVEGELYGTHRNDVVHRLLGYPQPIQGTVLQTFPPCRSLHYAECRRRTGFEAGDGSDAPPECWDLLLQLDSDRNAGMYWGSGGTMYLMMPAGGLKRRDFAGVRAIMECT